MDLHRENGVDSPYLFLYHCSSTVASLAHPEEKMFIILRLPLQTFVLASEVLPSIMLLHSLIYQNLDETRCVGLAKLA